MKTMFLVTGALALVAACGGASAGASPRARASAPEIAPEDVRTEPDSPDVAREQLVSRQMDRYSVGADAGR